jgi:succinate dehydrogenase / fumarate reductase membrane anchor subunit
VLLRESQIMKIHYLTGIGAMIVVAVHILFRLLFMPFETSLEYENVIANYHNIPYTIILEAILVLIAIHGFNGLRIILIEFRQNRSWEKSMTILTVIVMIGVIAYGTRTIIVANGLGVM